MTMRFQSVRFTHVKVLDLVGVANGHSSRTCGRCFCNPRTCLFSQSFSPLCSPLLPGLLPPCVGSLLLPPRGGLLLDSGLGHGHAT